MTPTKRCLVSTGVLEVDGKVDRQALERFVRSVANYRFTSGQALLEALGQDIGGIDQVGFADRGPMLFDFSKTRRMEEGLTFVPAPRSEALPTEDQDELLLPIAFVGDALIEPFWPEGLGIVRGFFAVLDACSAITLWSQEASRKEVEEHSDEAYVQLKTVAAATRARVLHKAENTYRLMPATRYRQFGRQELGGNGSSFSFYKGLRAGASRLAVSS